MRYLWAAPAGVAVVGTVLLIGALARLAEQAKGLRRDLRRFSELRPALVALRHATDEARQAAEALRHR